MYAVIETGGKQYKVAENDVIRVEKLEGNAGDVVKFDRVLVLANENGLTVGVTISGEVLEQAKNDKIIVFKKKRRHNYRRKQGHRQQVTVIRILDVSGKGEVKKAAAKKPAAKKAEPKAEEKKAAPKKEAAVKAETKKPAAKKTTAAKKPAAKKTTTTKKKED
jgi:large subunit ribosomal protein L21